MYTYVYYVLFQGLTFYKTPSVQPGGATLSDIIENAGGALVTRRPSVRHIREQRSEEGQPTFIVITCDSDLHLCDDLVTRQIGKILAHGSDLIHMHNHVFDHNSCYKIICIVYNPNCRLRSCVVCLHMIN